MTTPLPGATLRPQPHDDTMADPRPTPPQPSPAAHVPAARPGAWAQVAENPIPALLAGVIVVLLGFNFTSTHTRVSDTNDRITRLEARMNDRFDAQDDKIDELDQKLTAQIDEVDQKLTAEINEVDQKLTAQIDELDDKIDELDDKIDGISLTLTALIVALEASGAIEGVVENQTAATPAAG